MFHTMTCLLSVVAVLASAAQSQPGGGPWEHDLLLYRSADGEAWTRAGTFVEAGGVPSLIRLAGGRLLAAFQWFPQEDAEHFDRVAVKWSDDGGETWTEPQPVRVEGLPVGFQRPFDPTLTQLADGHIRLYFSCGPRRQGGLDEGVATYSALSADGIDYAFEPGARFWTIGRPVIDCAVARTGDRWHYCAPIGRPEEGAYCATSADGLSFARLRDLPAEAGQNWTGNLLTGGDGLRFYGTSPRGVWWAESKNGVEWTPPRYTSVRGGDPAVAQTSQGDWLLVCVSGDRHPRQPPPPPPTSGPYTHRICSASSADGLTWTRDPGVRMEHASVPCAIADGERILLYYVDANRGRGLPESVGCAVSTDGLIFRQQPFALDGLPTEKALDPCVVRDPNGRFRLYYLAANRRFMEEPRHEIHWAASDDGLRFREQGVAFARAALVDPDVFPFGGKWFMYVFGGGTTVFATSADGRQFDFGGPLALYGWGTTAPVPLDDGRLRLYAFGQWVRAGDPVCSFLSTDGLTWELEDGKRLIAGENEQLTDPFVIRWQGGWKMYFKVQEPPD
jgi:hypothetical protein